MSLLRRRKRKPDRHARHNTKPRLIESLEARLMLAGDWHNVKSAFDVNDDNNIISPHDALLIINELDEPTVSQPVTGELPDLVGDRPGSFFDVDCDGNVSPVDAVRVINVLSDIRAAPGWSFAEFGGTNEGRSDTVGNGCAPQLREGDSFVSSLESTFYVTDEVDEVSVTFSGLAFDTEDASFINDAFEVLLVDSLGNSLARGFTNSKEASFNITEGLDPRLSDLSRISDTVETNGQISGGRISLDVSHLPRGMQATLIARLVNNDSDHESSVTIADYVVPNVTSTNRESFLPITRRDVLTAVPKPPTGVVQEGLPKTTSSDTLSVVQFDAGIPTEAPVGSTILVSGLIDEQPVRVEGVDSVDAGGRFFKLVEVEPGRNDIEIDVFLAGNRVSTARFEIAAVDTTDELDIRRFEDVSGALGGVYGRTTQNQSDRLLTVELAVENGDRFAVNGPLLVGLENISNPNVALLNPDGFLPDGTPFVSFESSIDGALVPNEASRSVEVSFFNPTFNQFTYDLVFLGKLNRDPHINSLPRLEAISGTDYRYRVSGRDFDDDQIHFGLLQSPDGMTIDESSGEILWNVEPKDVGNHQVVVSVNDRRGGSNRQTFNLSAVEPPPNRPPMFTTAPVLVAVSNEPYVYDANASDPDFDLMSFALENGPEGMSIDAETGLTSWAVEGVGPSQHDVSITVSDGAGGVSRQAFVLAVKASPNNRAPVFVTEPPTSITIDGQNVSQYRYEARAIDFEGDEITYGRVSMPADMELDSASGVITWSPDANDLLSRSTVFDDGSFIDADWTRTAVDNGGSASSVQLTGGNPDEFIRVTTNTDGDGGQIWYFQTNNELVYDPRHLGAIRAVDYSLDIRYASGEVASLQMVILQDDKLFRNVAVPISTDGAWHRQMSLTRDAESFAFFDPRDPTAVNRDIKPNFSESGSEIRFGFVTTIGAALGSSRFGGSIDIDNFQVVVHPALRSDVAIEAFDQSGLSTVQSFTIELQLSSSIHGTVFADIDGDSEWDRSGRLLLRAAGLQQFDQETGSYLGFITSNPISAMDMGDDGFLYATDYNGNRINRISLSTGEVAPIVEGAPLELPGYIDVDGDDIYVGTALGSVHRVSKDTGELLDTGIVRDLRLLADVVIGPDGNLYVAYSNRGRFVGKYDFVTEKLDSLRVPASRLGHTIAFGPDGYLYVARQVESDVYRYNPENKAFVDKFLESQSFGIDGISQMAFADNGDLYISSSNAAKVFRVNPETKQLVQEIDTSEIGVPGPLTFAPGLPADEAEPGLSGWTVYLDLNRNSRLDAEEPATVTDPAGKYVFHDLTPGRYSVRQVVEEGWRQTTVNVRQEIMVAPGDSVYQVDFGNKRGNDVGNEPTSASENNAPQFVSSPPATASAGEAFAYSSIAFDPNGDPLAFTLPVKPDGMTINPDTGRIAWLPSADQIGTHQVVVNVRDGNGGADSQSFEIEVARANRPPLFTETEITDTAQVGREMRLRLTALDPEGDDVTFSLNSIAEESGVRVDENGILTWTPSPDLFDPEVPDDIVPIRVTATDAHGAASEPLRVNISLEENRSSPSIISSPREIVRLGSKYFYQVEYSSRSLESITYSLSDAPVGMHIDANGLIRWQPPHELSTYSFTIQVSDSDSFVSEQSVTLDVVANNVNTAPVILSNPTTRILTGGMYRYEPFAEDAEADVVRWSLETAPNGMVIDPESGVVLWEPDLHDAGPREVVLQVMDSQFVVDTQSFTIDVTCVPAVTRFTSIPVTEGFADFPYVYNAIATNLDGDDIRYRLVEGSYPEGMEIFRGQVTWLPGPEDVGVHRVVVSGQLDRPGYTAAEQEFFIEVFPNEGPETGNRPPAITSNPTFVADVGSEYLYQLVATDPEGDAVTFSLIEAPSENIQLDESTGLLTWTPVAGDATSEPQTMVIVATDEHGATGTQTYGITVNLNRPPEIISSPVEEVTAGATYRYDVQAIDPDVDDVSYQLVGTDESPIPVGMTIDRFGRIVWSTPSDATGAFPITVVAQDATSESAPQSFDINVMPDTEPPLVSVTMQVGSEVYRGNGVADEGAVVLFTVSASDNVSVSTVTLRVAGELLPLDDLGRATMSFPTIGTISVEASATDAAGNQGVRNQVLDVVPPGSNVSPRPDNPNDSRPGDTNPRDNEPIPVNPGIIDPNDSNRPIVEITSPEIGATVRDRVSIVGTVDDPEDRLWYFQVLFAPAANVDSYNIDPNDPDYTVLATRTNEVVAGELAVFDTSMVRNDGYAILVVAYDLNGQGYAQPTLLNVEGNVQFGNFRLEFTDISIPLSGIPIEVRRVYDTLDAVDSGDFGYGWSLGVANARIFETIPANYDFQPDDPTTPQNEGTKVYLTNPDGQRIGFTYTETLLAGGLFGDAVYGISFVPDPGVYDMLTVDLTRRVRGGLGGLFTAIAGGISSSPLFNFDDYTLTTKDGLKYRYSQTSGLQTITDTNGNVVTVTGDGIFHSSGPGIEFVRDHAGRITDARVLDENGEIQNDLSVSYEYDLKGDLISYFNGEGTETAYQYRELPAHYLERADTAGMLDFTVEFHEQTGQLLSIHDAEGNPVQTQEYDKLNQNIGVVRDGNGNATELLFDDRGNVLEERDPSYDPARPTEHVTFYRYEDPANPDQETTIIDRLGFVTQRHFDERGNLLEIIEAGYTDDPLAEELAITPLENGPITTRFTYDPANNVTSITNARNYTTAFEYVSNNLAEISNAAGDSASFTYYDNGDRKSFTDFNGNETTFAEYERGQPRLITFADGTYQRLYYTILGTVFGEEWFEADGTPVERSYTGWNLSTGQPVLELDGEVTDGKWNHVRKYYTDDGLLDWDVVVSPESTEETPLSVNWGDIRSDVVIFNGTETPDTPVAIRNSRITDYEYDPNGNLNRQINAEGHAVDFRYDANGNRVLLRDPVGNITTWVYDDQNRVVEERDPFYWENVRATDEALAGLSDDDFLEIIAPLEPVSPFDPSETRDPLYDDPSGANCDTNTGAEHVRLTCYDAEGNQAKAIDRNGRRREFEYDHADRLIEERWYNAPDHATAPSVLVETITFTYDTLGNMLTATDSNSNYLFTYDALNRLEAVDNNPNGTRDVPHVILTYDYDKQGNVTLTRDNFGVTVESTYNHHNLLESRKWFDADGSGDVDDTRVDFQYNAAGRELAVQRYTDLNATTPVGSTSRTYDLAGRSDILKHCNALDCAANLAEVSTLLAAYDYDYDFSGLLTHEQRSHQDAQFAQSVDYDYDLTGQLTDAMFTGQDDEHYEYDANGNRLRSQVGSDQRTYAPDTANQLDSDGHYRYEYDGEGNHVKRIDLATGETRTFEYDLRNRLVRVDEWSSDPGDPQTPNTGTILIESVEYSYDAVNRRIGDVYDRDGAGERAGERRHTFYLNENAWLESDADKSVMARFLSRNQFDGHLAEFAESDRQQWYLADQQGSLRDQLRASDTSTTHVDFTAFGDVVSAQADARYMFTGRPYDSRFRHHFFRARYYDPQTGRFSSSDPIGMEAGDANLYRFLFNSPQNGVDPFGRTVITENASLNSRLAAFEQTALRCFGKAIFSAAAQGGVYVLLSTTIAPTIGGGVSNVYVGSTKDFIVRFSRHTTSGIGGRGLDILAQVRIPLAEEVFKNPTKLRQVEQLLINSFKGNGKTKVELLNKINASRKIPC